MEPDETSLDPKDWSELRALGHRMVDELFDHMAALRSQPVWRPLPLSLRAQLRGEPLPRQGRAPEQVYQEARDLLFRYGLGSIHPGFMGWVHGGGNPVGALAELFAAGINANLGGRDHVAIEMERQVIRWVAELLGFPSESAGLLVTGSSQANLMGVLVARSAALGPSVRAHGIGDAKLAAYTSAAAHACIPRAFEIAGLGRETLREIPVDSEYQMDLAELRKAIREDKARGYRPFLLLATAGTVDTGAIDPLARLAEIARAEGMWLHVDGAIGALLACAPALREKIAGIEQAQSVALDFHKWGQVPYDAGCFLARSAAPLLATFGQNPHYLQPTARGLAAGTPWPFELGPDLSRGFRALKVWMTLKTYGTERLGACIAQCCALARYAAARISAEPELELLAPVPLNIVCFRYRNGNTLDTLNADIVADVQESGLAVPSLTRIQGKLAIRAAIVNHRTRREDIDALLDAVLKMGRLRAAQSA